VKAFAGHLHFEANRAPEGQTFLGQQSFRAPFHLSKAYWDGSVLQVRIVNVTAGILAGDHLELDVRVAPGASLLVTTPAATRAFMMTSGAAECRQGFTVAAGAWLEYAPEPLFPHRDSEYAQTTRLEVAEGAEVYFTDALAPGRAGRGETWGWRNLQLTLDVEHAGVPVLRERLSGAGADLARRASFFGMGEAWFGTVIVFSSRLGEDRAFWERVAAAGGERCHLGATALRGGGWIVRLIATDSQALREALAGLRLLFAEKLPRLRSDLRRV
jgi:urease accessory protein